MPGHWSFGSLAGAQLLACLPLVLCCGAADAQEGGGNAVVEGLEPLRTPADFFPILPWCRRHASESPRWAQLTAECNFTIAGFVKPKDVVECAAAGLKIIVSGPNDRGPLSHADWRDFSEEQIRGFVKKMVDEAGDSDAVLGYYLVDEPGALLFPKLAIGVDAVKKLAPGKLAYINLYPGYATIGAPDTSQLQTKSFTEYLERFVHEVKPQIISYDDYMVQYSQDLKDKKRAARYYLDLMEIRRVALKYGLPFWNIVSSNQIRPHTTIPSPANMQFQAFTTLAAGGRGVSWYTYVARGYGYAPLNKSGERTATWQYLQMVNAQLKTLGPVMNTLQSTGVFFTKPAPVDGLPLLPGKLVKAVECETPVMVGEFARKDGAASVMAVNLSVERSAKVKLTLAPPHKKALAVSSASGELIPVEEGPAVWLTAGQGALLELR